jgi:flagellin
MSAVGAIGGSNLDLYSKLASGNRLQKAKESPADLAIAEKMKLQANTESALQENAVMQNAANNIKDAAMSGMMDYAQSANELFVRESNGLMSADDKLAIRNQVQQYQVGSEQIASATKFNESYVLSGFNPNEGGDAIKAINDARGKTGAETNGLAAATRASAVTEENTTAALSRISDTDMSKAAMQLKTEKTLEAYRVQMQKQQQDNEANLMGMVFAKQ